MRPIRQAMTEAEHQRVSTSESIVRIGGATLIVALLVATGCDRGQPASAASNVKPPAPAPVDDPAPAKPAAESNNRRQPPPPAATQMARPNITGDLTPRELYVAYCSGCHSLDLIESQRLDRTTWEWVMDDVINKYGATWITDDERAVLTDFLVANFGRDSTP